MEVACRGHHRQEGIQGGENQGTKTKQTRATTYNMRRARKATIYIYKWCKTAQIGRHSKDKDNECATQRNKNEEGGKGVQQSNQIRKEVNSHREGHHEYRTPLRYITGRQTGKQTPRNNSNEAKQNKIAHVITVQLH